MGPDPSDPKDSGPMGLGLGPGPNILGPMGPCFGLGPWTPNRTQNPLF